MPLPGKCYLLVFPEETIGPSIPYGNRNKRRTKPYIAVFRGIENVVLLRAVSVSVGC